jgi:hypothetical protein
MRFTIASFQAQLDIFLKHIAQSWALVDSNFYIMTLVLPLFYDNDAFEVAGPNKLKTILLALPFHQSIWWIILPKAYTANMGHN